MLNLNIILSLVLYAMLLLPLYGQEGGASAPYDVLEVDRSFENSDFVELSSNGTLVNESGAYVFSSHNLLYNGPAVPIFDNPPGDKRSPRYVRGHTADDDYFYASALTYPPRSVYSFTRGAHGSPIDSTKRLTISQGYLSGTYRQGGGSDDSDGGVVVKDGLFYGLLHRGRNSVVSIGRAQYEEESDTIFKEAFSLRHRSICADVFSEEVYLVVLDFEAEASVGEDKFVKKIIPFSKSDTSYVRVRSMKVMSNGHIFLHLYQKIDERGPGSCKELIHVMELDPDDLENDDGSLKVLRSLELPSTREPHIFIDSVAGAWYLIYDNDVYLLNNDWDIENYEKKFEEPRGHRRNKSVTAGKDGNLYILNNDGFHILNEELELFFRANSYFGGFFKWFEGDSVVRGLGFLPLLDENFNQGDRRYEALFRRKIREPIYPFYHFGANALGVNGVTSIYNHVRQSTVNEDSLIDDPKSPHSYVFISPGEDKERIARDIVRRGQYILPDDWAATLRTISGNIFTIAYSAGFDVNLFNSKELHYFYLHLVDSSETFLYEGSQKEICDGIDNDNDGITDEGFNKLTYYEDRDQDNLGNSLVSLISCTKPQGYVQDSTDTNDDCNLDRDGIVFYRDSDGDTLGSNTDSIIACTKPSNYVSNNTDLDDECNLVMNGVIYYEDRDQDNLGNSLVSLISCTKPQGYVQDSTDTNDDCNLDRDGIVFYRDSDGDTLGSNTDSIIACTKPSNYVSNNTDLDDECNLVMNGVIYYEDRDQDNLGNSLVSLISCTKPQGYVQDSTDTNDDCNLDRDGIVFYRDSDGDTLGSNTDSIIACTKPSNYVSNNTDLDDECNLVMNGVIYYEDRDQDNLGNSLVSLISCTKPQGYVQDSTDTNDDCNLDRDGIVFYRDSDGDTLGSNTDSIIACTKPSNYVSNNTDLDDECNLVMNGVIYYEDRDQDNLGNSLVSLISCTKPQGYVQDSTDTNDDCNLDRDGIVFYRDSDGDTLGSNTDSIIACTKPSNYVSNNTDLDDECNLVMNGVIYYEDRDQDSLGNSFVSLISCTKPQGYVQDSTDTNDDCNKASCENPILSFVEKELEMLVFPNPIVQSFTIKEAKGLHFSLHSLSGRVLKEGKIHNNYFSINIEIYPKGIYIFRLGSKFMKIIKQ